MEHGEINVAVEAYLRAYMQPPLTAEQIYLGQQNNSALPKTREHVVFFSCQYPPDRYECRGTDCNGSRHNGNTFLP